MELANLHLAVAISMAADVGVPLSLSINIAWH